MRLLMSVPTMRWAFVRLRLMRSDAASLPGRSLVHILPMAPVGLPSSTMSQRERRVRGPLTSRLMVKPNLHVNGMTTVITDEIVQHRILAPIPWGGTALPLVGPTGPMVMMGRIIS